MVKKLKVLATTDDRQLAEAVRTSAQQIWQAGLGAFAKAQEEGGKVYAMLVKEGTELQQRTHKLAGDKVSDVSDTVTRMADSVSKQAAGSWDKLEQVFEDRVARSLSSLGVPTQKDIQTLIRRIEELNKAVATLSGKKPAAAKTTARSSARAAVTLPTKPAPRKAVAKPAVKPAGKTKAGAKTTTKKSATSAAV